MTYEKFKTEVIEEIKKDYEFPDFPHLHYNGNQFYGHINPCKHGYQYGVLKNECTNHKCPSKYCFFSWFTNDIIKDYHCPYFEPNPHWANSHVEFLFCRKQTILNMKEKLKLKFDIDDKSYGINNFNEYAFKPTVMWIIGASDDVTEEMVLAKFPFLERTPITKYIVTINDIDGDIKSKVEQYSAKHSLTYFTPNAFLKWDDNMKDSIFNSAISDIKSTLANKHLNMITRMKFSEKIMTNEIMNTGIINQCQLSYDYKNKFKNQIVVCVTAGPSLQDQIKTLKHIQDKVIIICASTCYKVLLKNGITPDIVGIIDMQQDIEVYFHDVDDDVMQKTKLLFEIDADFNTVNYYKGDKIIHIASAFTNPYTAKVGEVLGIDKDIDRPKNGTVSNLLYSFALMTTPKEIWLMGYDLCYDDNRSHVEGTDNYQEIEILDGTNNSKFIKFKKSGKAQPVYPIQCFDNKTRWQSQEFKTYFDEINFITSFFKNGMEVYAFSEKGSKFSEIELVKLDDKIKSTNINNWHDQSTDKQIIMDSVDKIKVKNKSLKTIIKSLIEGRDQDDSKALFATRFSFIILIYQNYTVFKYKSIVNDLKNTLNVYVKKCNISKIAKDALELLKKGN